MRLHSILGGMMDDPNRYDLYAVWFRILHILCQHVSQLINVIEIQELSA